MNPDFLCSLVESLSSRAAFREESRIRRRVQRRVQEIRVVLGRDSEIYYSRQTLP